ncbi:MAG TPA: serine hydrolase [bacterium]|nr:serine hydrolase [bacterium]
MIYSAKHFLDKRQTGHLRRFVNETIKRWQVPGVAIGVVSDNETVLAEGFGIRGLKCKSPVSAETLFAIASCTKAFTSLAVAIAVEEGKISWDTPVREYLPEFRLSDPCASERITPKDLLTHASGLPRHDDVWWKCNDTREEYVHKLRFLEPSKDLRSKYQYQNLMYMVAGYLVGKVYGTTWEAFLQSRLLDPLKMTATNFSIADSRKSDDYAFPHVTIKNKTRSTDFYDILEGVGPAGSMNSNVTDMLKWLSFHLNKGLIDGQQIVPEACVLKTHTPQIVCEPSGFKAMPYLTYAMGWHATQYRGFRLLFHGGNVGGFSCNTAFLPDENVGIVVLTNLSSSSVGKIVTYHLCDLLLLGNQTSNKTVSSKSTHRKGARIADTSAGTGLLEMKPLPWNDLYQEQVDKERAEAKKKQQQQRRNRVKGTKPSHSLAEFVGNYRNQAYGSMRVTLQKGSLYCEYQEKVLPLVHYHYDVFERVDASYGSRTLVAFHTRTNGHIGNLSIRLEPEVSEIIFERVRDGSPV